MLKNRPYFCFIILVLAVLAYCLLPVAWAHAQGDDFPGFSPSAPIWTQPGLPSPVPGYDYTQGVIWGPVYQYNVHSGDTVTLRVVMDWYGLGPLSLGVHVSGNPSNLRWIGPDTQAGRWDHGQLGQWCLDCQFSFTAGEDNPSILMDYAGSRQFGAHIEVIDIAPAAVPSWFSVLTDPDKGTAGGLSSFMTGVTAGAAAAVAGFSYVGEGRGAALFTAIGVGTSALANWFSDIARDPWDADFCSEAPFSWDDGYEWARPYDDPAYGWTISSMEYISSYSNQAIIAANRALSAAEAGAYDCAFGQRSTAIWAMNRVGDHMWELAWALGQTADYYSGQGYDMSSTYDQISGIQWTAGWLEGLPQ